MFLALARFWNIFSLTDKRKLRSTFYKFLKFLLNVPLWAKNSFLSNKYGAAEPVAAILKRRAKFLRSLDPANSLNLAISP